MSSLPSPDVSTATTNQFNAIGSVTDFFYNAFLGQLSPGQLAAGGNQVYNECINAGGDPANCSQASAQAQTVGTQSGRMSPVERWIIYGVLAFSAVYVIGQYVRGRA